MYKLIFKSAQLHCVSHLFQKGYFKSESFYQKIILKINFSSTYYNVNSKFFVTNQITIV